MNLNDKQMRFGSAKAVKAYLRSRGIPESTVRGISSALIDDAIRQSDSLLIARFFTAFALALRLGTSHLIEEKRPEKTEEEKAELYRWLEMQRGNVNGV